jgi:CubicO group peptidase (beta-lactamase class C family)
MRKYGTPLGTLILLAALSLACREAWAVEAKEKHTDEGAANRQEALKDFLNCRVVPKLGNPWDYVFEPGRFPEVGWDRPHVVETALGKLQLHVRWFDGTLAEVTAPKDPGRYAFYVEARTSHGAVVRRASTVYCRPKNWFGWIERPKAHLDFIPIDGVSRRAWDKHQDAITAFAGRMVLQSILRQQEGAVLMSYLHEMEVTGEESTLTDSPIIRDHDFHLALKRKILAIENAYPPLKMPRNTKPKSAAVLHEGTEKEAGFKPGTADRLREVCREWFEASGEPFIVLVARHGVVVINEPLGQWTWGQLTRETATEMASLTKLVTGLLFAQFVDQGLVGIDDPVGRYLPDFPVSGDKVITLRQCFTHTTGLYGHEEWGGLHNPWLDNVIANGLELLSPGKVHNYNGMGYDLAGKVMEVVSGKSIFRLMRENLFDPLEMKNTVLEEDLGFSCFSTAGEFARLGQLLLNRGSYGDIEFFSPETFAQIQPKPLSQYYPDIDKDWGIGITWMRQAHPDAGTNSVPKDATILSKNVIGHGSATSAILRVDLDNDLVIAQSRRRGGKDYGKYLAKFLMTIDDGLE